MKRTLDPKLYRQKEVWESYWTVNLFWEGKDASESKNVSPEGEISSHRELLPKLNSQSRNYEKIPCWISELSWTSDTRDPGSTPGLGRFPWERKGYPPQYSGLENSMDCIVYVVHGVTESWTRLSDFHRERGVILVGLSFPHCSFFTHVLPLYTGFGGMRGGQISSQAFK